MSGWISSSSSFFSSSFLPDGGRRNEIFWSNIYQCVLLRNLACAFVLNVHKRKGNEIGRSAHDALVNHTQQSFVGFSWRREKRKILIRRREESDTFETNIQLVIPLYGIISDITDSKYPLFSSSTLYPFMEQISSLCSITTTISELSKRSKDCWSHRICMSERHRKDSSTKIILHVLWKEFCLYSSPLRSDQRKCSLQRISNNPVWNKVCSTNWDLLSERFNRCLCKA